MFSLLPYCPFLILRGMEMLSFNNELMTFYFFLILERATNPVVRQREIISTFMFHLGDGSQLHNGNNAVSISLAKP